VAQTMVGKTPPEEVEVIRHQAVAEKTERITLVGVGDGLKEGNMISVIGEDIAAIVAPIKGLVDQPVVNGSR
jgi:hypothetical protein